MGDDTLNRRSFCYNMVALPAAASLTKARAALARTAAGEPRTFDAAGEMRFVVQDHLKHPFYWWPDTLVSYPVEFRQTIDHSRLLLTDAMTGKPVPMQLANVSRSGTGRQTATLHFFSDLPSDGRREFVLTTATAPPPLPSGVKETHDGNSIILD